MNHMKICMKMSLFFLIFLTLHAARAPAKAYGAYHHSGIALENTFSIAAVGTFYATLSPKIEAGNGSRMKLCWYRRTETGWKKTGTAHTLPNDGAEALQKAQLRVEVSFRKDHQEYRYELSNEAGTVLSEVFRLSVSQDGSAVICRREPYEPDLSDHRPQ